MYFDIEALLKEMKMHLDHILFYLDYFSSFFYKICLNEVPLISLITSAVYAFSYQSESPFLILFI